MCSSDLTGGIDTSDEAIALDILKEVGHEGKFLTHRHTLKWFTKEQFIPSPVIDRSTRREWADSGEKSCRERSKDMIDKLLKSAKGKVIDKETEKKLNDIMLSQKGFPEKLIEG